MWLKLKKALAWLFIQHAGEIVGTIVIGGSIAAVLQAVSKTIEISALIIIGIPICLGFAAAYVVNRLKYISELVTRKGLEVYETQEEAAPDLRRFIESQKPRRAYLLEYSSRTIFDNVLKPLVDVGAEIQLLLQYPDGEPGKKPEYVISEYQRDRICSHIRTVLSIEIGTYDKLRIRCYKQRASLRGRNFDNELINIGWYTYDLRPQELDPKMEPVQIWGHNNPLITVSKQEENFGKTQKFFTKVFDNLWRDSEPLKAVCNSCKRSCDVKSRSEWLEQVSK